MSPAGQLHAWIQSKVHTWRRQHARALIVAGVALGIVGVALVLRVRWGSRTELAQARTALSQQQTERAIVHLRRAARWYVPGSGDVQAALTLLAGLGREAERTGKREQALMAWRAIRGAILATRSFYTPHRGRLDEADRHIAALMAHAEPPPIDAGKSWRRRRDEHWALLQDARRRPQPGWALLACIGLVTGFVALWRLWGDSFDGAGHFTWRRARLPLLWALCGVAAFVLGLRWA
ncbi:MAG: hypothetical protein ACPGUV_10380 [Polyangiales bacterium]